MLPVDASILRRLVPVNNGARGARQNEIIDGMGASIAATLDGYEVNTPLRIAHFLAQTAHESDGLVTTEEYASGQAYEGRRDLGNIEPGDGPRFKGRGLIQLTGRANYQRVGAALNLDLVGAPLSVSTPSVYLLVSCEFWKEKAINPHCDADDLIAITRIVNGGLNGLDSRRAYLAAAKNAVAALTAGGVPPPADGVPVMVRGSSGDAVTELQRRLAAHGYPVAIDGDYGAATDLAVRHFQAASGLAADGVVGAQTWAALS